MKSKQFNCKICLFSKKWYKSYQNEYGEIKYEYINFLYLMYHKFFISSKNFEYKPLYKICLKWLGERFTKLIDNCLNVIGAGFIGYIIMKLFE